MSERRQGYRPGDDWLTRGSPKPIRTRGVAVRTRGATAAALGSELTGIEEVSKLLQQLDREVPEVPWVVVVEGTMSDFVEAICLRAKQIRGNSRFLLVQSRPLEPAAAGRVAALEAVSLDPQNEADVRFLNNLIADLVIVSSEPKATQRERVRRWLTQARYILAEEFGESLIEELRRAEPAGVSKAEIFIIKGEE